jgi:hypothetical protein
MSRTRRWVLELLGAVALLETSRPCGRAANNNNKNKLLKVLFFSKSSGFEHDVVKRTDEGQSLSETKLTELGRTLGFDVVATKDGRVFDSDFSQYDAFFFFTTGNLTEARKETVSPGAGLAPEITVLADAEIPERRMTVAWSLRRNTDKALPASHTIEINPPIFPGRGIANVPRILMAEADQVRGSPLSGLAVKMTDGFYV